MKIWYCSEQRFINRIKARWKKKGFRFNAGHENILKFSFVTVKYFANLEKQKTSKINKIDVQPKLFYMKVIPFSNATDASTWLYHNCEQCRRSGCTKKTSIDRGWITGHVTQKVADYCGDFKNQCKNFSSVRIAPVKKQKQELTKSLF